MLVWHLKYSQTYVDSTYVTNMTICTSDGLNRMINNVHWMFMVWKISENISLRRIQFLKKKKKNIVNGEYSGRNEKVYDFTFESPTG